MASLVNHPDSHGLVSAARDQLVHLADINHVQNAPLMANNSLDASVTFCVFRVPELNCSVCRGRYQDVELAFVDFRPKDLTNFAFVGIL